LLNGDRNFPVGDNDLKLNLDDFGASETGEDGRRDLRKAGAAEVESLLGGVMGRTADVLLIVGAGSVLIDRRMLIAPFMPREARFRCRSFWKLLTEASESLS
jgi:hypothetical protein